VRRKTRIMIADDHRIMREGLRAMITGNDTMEVVAEAESGRQAIEMALLHNPDIVTMDIGFPDINGVVATREILSQKPDINVIALSMHADRHYVVEIMRAGAKAFLLKDCAFSELMAAVKASLEGRRFLSQAVTGIVVEDVLCGNYPGTASALARLTDREIAVLKMMAEGAVAKEIGKRLNVASTTIATYQQRLRKKLGISNIVELTKLAIREGLIPLDSRLGSPPSSLAKFK
jgi:two-component system response regulator NreC